MKKTFEVVDMFCGAGGESTGIMQAAQEREMNVRLTAINHWERAIETHAANHPGAEHLCQSVEHIDPAKAVPGQRLDLLWASPECTHHSVARGERPRSGQSRASAWLVLKWLSELYVSRVIIENVPEFLSWGPPDDKGRPIPGRKGKTFRAFIAALRSLGYSADWRILNAADYGDPTTRRRLFIQAVKGRKKILWPQITHMNGGENLMGYKPWRPARDIIDWSIPGTSIFDRKRPLAAATMRRIAGGIRKYWENYAEPFLAVLYGTAATSSRNDARPLDRPFPTVTDSGAHHALVEPFLIDNHTAGTPERIDEPLRTVTTKGWFGMIEPFITRYNGGENRNHDVASPLPTLDTSNRYGLVEPLLVEYYGQGKTSPVSLPVKTITTKDRFALLEPFLLRISQTSVGDRTRSINEPLSTVMTKNEHCLVSPEQLDIRFRMLRPHELARAQGFPDDYRILGNRAEQTKQIGNAVPVNTAKALAKAVMEL